MLLVFPGTQNAYSGTRQVVLDKIEISPDGLNIKINLNGAIDTKSFIVARPARWVLDITPAKWSDDVLRKSVPKDTSYFSQLRTGQWRTNTARLVIHTKEGTPEVKIDNDVLLITFESGDSSPESDGFPNPFLGEITDPETIDEIDGNTDYEVIEIPKVLPTEVDSIDTIVVPTSDKTQDQSSLLEIGGLTKITETGKWATDMPKFEIYCDGATTLIDVPLVGDQSFDIRKEKFPERLTIEYPSRALLSNANKLSYSSLGKEYLPLGIVDYCTRYVSLNFTGYNKLVFYTNDKFNYQTRVENGTLNIDILNLHTTAKSSSNEPEIARDQINAGAKIATDSLAPILLLEGEPVDITTPPAVEVSRDETGTQLTGLKSGFEEDTQTFTPPDKSYSFIINEPEEIDGTDHTVPEAGLGTRISKVETTTDARQASLREMTEFLPGFANDSLKEGSESLKTREITGDNLIASGPMMIDPPQDTMLLPKGSRPAADLFLSIGESVILPVKTLIRASVGDPEVLVVNVLSQEELLLTSKGVGRTTLITWEDGVGRSVRWVNVSKSELLRTIDIERVIGNPNIKVNFIGDKTVVLEGKVETESEMKRAVSIAAGAVEKVENVVNLIEMSNPKQVLVKVRFVEIQTKDKEDFLNQFGTGSRTEKGDFQFNILTDILNPEFATGGIFDISLHPSIVKGNDSGDMRFDPLDLVLSYLEQSRTGRILSQPNLVTLSGHPAEFRVGGEVPYTYQNAQGFNVVDFREFGVELKMTPTVDSDNNINITLQPSVRVPDFTLAIAGIPGFKTRLVSTSIQVHDSQTIVIGGLIHHEITTIKSKVPVLGDIPLIGELFRSKKTTDDETELLIFLTPMVLKDISSVESDIKSESDISLSPYYKREVIEGLKEKED